MLNNNKILIPTDFTIESLNLVKHVLNQSTVGEKLNIVLLHGMFHRDSIREMLFFSKAKVIKSLENDYFNDACRVIENKYSSQINSFYVDIFSGFTKAAFRNYIEGNDIVEAVIPSNHQFSFKDRNSFDVLPYIKKSNLKITEVELEAKPGIPENEKFAELFLTWGIQA